MPIIITAITTWRCLAGRLRLLHGNGGAVNWQPAQGHARCRIDRIAQGGRAGGGACLADTARMLATLDHVDVDRWCLIDSQHSVIVEIRLLHAAFLDRDLAP